MSDSQTPHRTLLVLRLFWAASLVTQVILAIILINVFSTDQRLVNPRVGQVLVYIAAAALLVAVPVGYFIRNQIYKAHWREHAISPAGYFTGNLVLLGMMETISVVAIVFAFVDGRALPAMYVAGAAILVQLINFPTGRPMQRTAPVFDSQDRS